MSKVIMLAALLLSVIGGLTVMSGPSPLAAQTSPSASRSFDDATVAPGATVSVTIAVADYSAPGRVVETIPSGFTYVDGSYAAVGGTTRLVSSDQGELQINLLGGPITISYDVTAGTSDGTFSGELIDSTDGTTPRRTPVSGDSVVTVSSGGTTTPDPSPTPDPAPAPASLSVTSAVDDFDLELSVGSDSNKQITLDGGVFGGGEDDKAYTAMTTDPVKVALSLAGGYDEAPDNGAVAAWWDNMEDSDIPSYAGATDDQKLAITQEFHWDLLSGQEMYDAAAAGGLSNPANYKKRHSALTAAEQANVEGLYGTVLHRGAGNTLTATAGDGSDDNNDLLADNVGSATVTVKVADSAGPDLSDPAHAVGDDFEVSVVYLPLDDIDGITLMAADSSVVVDNGAGRITISDNTMRNVATVTADVQRAPHQQLINFSLVNGSNLAYNIDGDGTTNVATLVIKAGASAPDTSSFTIVANEEGRSANRYRMDVTVEKASGNMPPVFNDAALDSATAGVKILEFMANDAVTSVGLPINFGHYASDNDNQVLDYAISPQNMGLKINSATGMVTADNRTGVAYADNPNGIEFTVTVSDGTLDDTYSFTAEIATNMPRANDALSNVTVTGPGTATATIMVGSPTEGVPQDDRNAMVVDLASLLMPVHDAGAVTPKFIGPTISPFQLDGLVLELSGVPDARPDYILVYGPSAGAEGGAVTIELDDGYPSAGADLTLTLEITVYVAKPPQVGSSSKTIMVNENWADVLPGTADLYNPQGSGVTPYYHYASGEGNADLTGDDSAFSVNTGTGEVTLNVEQDFEEDPNEHRLTIFVRDGDEVASLLEVINITVRENNVNEAPTFAADAPTSLGVNENDQPGTTVGDPITATDQDAGDSRAYSIKESGVPFSVDATSGQISVSGALDLTASPYTVTLVATDNGGLTDEHAVSITIGDINDPPTFDAPVTTTESIPETAPAGHVVATYEGSDVDGSDTLEGLHYVLRDADDLKNFEIMSDNVSGEIIGKLMVKQGANLDVDAAGTVSAYTVEVNICDTDNACNELTIDISIEDVNDEAPMFATDSAVTVMVAENTARGTALTSAIAPNGVYAAPDGDKTAPNNTVTYSIDSKSFHIDENTGLLTVLESLDFDSGTPCGATGCQLKITATDGGTPAKTDTLDITVNVVNAEDSVSTFNISKANPVPGVSMGNPDSALADTKAGMYGIPERPSDQPATEGSGPMNFVATDWASWDTVLRIAVTAESPNADCGMNVANQNNNQCVYIDVESDSAGNKLRLEAYRSANQENLFIAAVKLVEKDPTDDGDGKDGDINAPVYKDAAGGVARLEADEEDEVIFRLVGSTAPPIAIDVENEDPEFNNFMPEHESAFDDGDVEYSFTVTDPVSGIPEPEDLAGDTDGDGDYMPLVALISDHQVHTKDPNDKSYSMYEFAGNAIWAKSKPAIRQVVDDRDFDEIDDGFEVSTKIVLPENEAKYVTFIVCDNAGNCAMYTPDENDTDEAFAEITIDTEDPDLIEARTGIKWDSTDSEYDDDSTFIQLLFNDLTALDPTSIEADDFVIEGHTIKAVHWYDVSDGDDDTAWGDDDPATTPSRFAMGGSTTLRGHPLRQSIRNAVFIELEDELAPDETPDVTIVPNGILDSAGNEQDDDEVEADDWIAPSFTVVSIASSRTPEGSSNQLAGDGDEVVITLTSDERIQQTRPIVTVTYVNAPAGCVNTAQSDDYARGQIKTGGDCGSSATGGSLGTTFERVSNTEWIVTVDEPDDTGYYNIHIKGNDRSEQRNEGSEGIAPGSIAKSFFERDGDVNTDDAHFFQGDINLSNPGVRVSGVQIEDTEPTVEFKTPLFVELDFTRPYIADCADDADDDERNANCYAESDEYAKDSFDAVTVTSFTLNGTDMTDSVKTTDDETFLVSLEGIEIGDHEIEIQAMDQAGNTLDKALSIEFEVEERDPFDTRLNPGWNLVSLPGEPADSDISVVFGSDMEVRTVYTYNPIIPGGWMVAVRESKDSEWQGDLTEITARQGYWVLSDAIQDWEVSIPRLAGGAVGSGTPIQPPVIALYAGWNLVPVIDVTGDFAGGGISAQAYLQSLDDGLDLARVLGFDTITNSWSTVMAPESGDSDKLYFGKAYWVFVRQAASLVPGN